MAGRVQIETVGPQDRLFTDDPEYTYFIKNFKKHGNYARFYDDLDFTGHTEFDEEVRCVIPQDQGDLIKGLSLKITLGAIDQSISPSHDHVTYCESIAQAMIEYAELYIGGTLVQRIPSDMLAIHSEVFVTQSKQSALRKLVGKPDKIFPIYTDYYAGIRDDRVDSSKVDTSYRVDLPFYFHEHPELAIPLHAITKQEVEVVIKFRKAEECIFALNNTLYGNDNVSYYLGQNPKNLIKNLNLVTEMVSLKDKTFPKRVDYIVTQTQTNTFELNKHDGKPDTVNKSNVHEVRLSFNNPVKELFFVVKDKFENNPSVINDFATPYQYCSTAYVDRYNLFTSNEQVKYIEMNFDGEPILDEVTGNIVHLRAIQPGKHHSRTTVYRRFYSYSFALEPERWYPTGQLNFSQIKNQLVRIGLFDYTSNKDKQLRVYAQSYNILRVENGTCTLLFDT